MIDKVHEETVEASARGHHTLWKFWNNDYSIWLQEKWNYFTVQYSRGQKYPQLKNYDERLLTILYTILNSNLRTANLGTSKVSPGFNHETMDCYLIVSPKPLKKSDCSSGTIRYSSIELYNFLMRGTLLPETAGNSPKRFKLVWKDRLHHTHQTTVLLQKTRKHLNSLLSSHSSYYERLFVHIILHQLDMIRISFIVLELWQSFIKTVILARENLVFTLRNELVVQLCTRF